MVNEGSIQTIKGGKQAADNIGSQDEAQPCITPSETPLGRKKEPLG